MPSETDICNLAISHIGRKSIASLNDAQLEAKECNRIYPTLRDAVLCAFPWGFATRYQELALRADVQYGNWAFSYAVPSDCLTVRRIHNPAGDDIPVEFDVVAAPDLSSKIILCNQPSATLVYTARVTDSNMYDMTFVDALSWRIAADLSVQFKGDPAIQQAAFNAYTHLLGMAQQKNSRETFKKPSDESDFSRSRA